MTHNNKCISCKDRELVQFLKKLDEDVWSPDLENALKELEKEGVIRIVKLEVDEEEQE